MRRFTLAVAVLWVTTVALAQEPVTGFPPYGSFEDGRFDAVNRQNLNVNFGVPIVLSPGRGVDFNFSVVQDSLIWQRTTTGSTAKWSPVVDKDGNPTWGWKMTPALGYVTATAKSLLCDPENPNSRYILRLGYRYYDPRGTPHPFSVWSSTSTQQGCSGGVLTGWATDGSGYYIDISSLVAPIVRTPFGASIVLNGFTGSETLTDTNGNQIGKVVVSSAETHWKDALGRIVLKIIKGSNYIDYLVLDKDNGYQTTRINLSTYNIKTKFSCTGVTEYSGTGSLPTSVVLPNGQSYSITYEDTPTMTGYKTGRVKRVTLPTGGYYEYQYPATPNNGINCADGTVKSLTRVINNGSTSATWTFSRAQVGSNWETTVTAPPLPYDAAGNKSVFTFNPSGLLITQKSYQGTSTLLRTINTTWTTGTPATPASTTVILENNQQAKTETTFDSYSNLTSLKEYDWGSGGPGPLVRETTLTYETGSAYADRNIRNRLKQRLVRDGSGTVKSKTDIAYDQPTYSNTQCPAGAAQHDDAGYGCSFLTRGNPTTITSYEFPATGGGAQERHFYYDWFGNIRQADLDCCQQKQWNYSSSTQYAYADSVVSGPPGTQLTANATYNFYTGLVVSSTNENNKVTSLAYDSFGRLTVVTRPDNAQITTAYDDVNRTVTVAIPLQGTDKARQKTEFDGLGRPYRQSILDAGATTYSVVETQYDVLGRVYKVSNPFTGAPQYWTEHRFDALGRPTLTIPPDGTATSNRTQYSYAGNTVTFTDPTGKQRKTETDGLGRLIKVYEPDVNNGNQLTQLTTNSYNALDQLTQVLQGAQTRTYNYDGLGRLTSAITPEAGTVSYQYNNFNRVTLRTDARGVDTTYSYDGLNRLSQVSYDVSGTTAAATPAVTFTYGFAANLNNNGRLVSMTDGTGSEAYEYDPNLPLIKKVTKTLDGVPYVSQHAYNLAGELTSITYPSGRVVQQNYDQVGRLSQIASGTTTYANLFSYNSAGQVTGFNYGNGVAAIYGYSAERLQLNSLKYTKGTSTLFHLTYGYTQGGGNNGQIASITDNVDPTRSSSYAYDAPGRLREASITGSATSKWHYLYNYDRYGNLTAKSLQPDSIGLHPGLSIAVSPTTNRVTESGFTYDAGGNLTQDGTGTGTHAYKYDAENRMILVDNGSTATYTDDGAGLRVKKVAGSTTSRYAFSGTRVIAEYVNGAAVGSPTREYIYSGSRLLATVEGSTTTYHHQDHLSVRVNTNSAGTVVGQQGYYPFGEAWYATSSTTKWQFTSYERDSESALDYAMTRYDSSRLGRFLSPDPFAGSVADPQSLNRYGYVRNDPLNFTDPLGLLQIPIIDCEAGERSVSCFPIGFIDIAPRVPFQHEGGGGGGGGNITQAEQDRYGEYDCTTEEGKKAAADELVDRIRKRDLAGVEPTYSLVSIDPRDGTTRWYVEFSTDPRVTTPYKANIKRFWLDPELNDRSLKSPGFEVEEVSDFAKRRPMSQDSKFYARGDVDPISPHESTQGHLDTLRDTPCASLHRDDRNTGKKK